MSTVYMNFFCLSLSLSVILYDHSLIESPSLSLFFYHVHFCMDFVSRIIFFISLYHVHSFKKSFFCLTFSLTVLLSVIFNVFIDLTRNDLTLHYLTRNDLTRLYLLQWFGFYKPGQAKDVLPMEQTKLWQEVG